MTKRAVVLAGGGARGAYHIGVWQALREMEIGFQIVTGTSIGALNAALMAQGDFQSAKAAWLRMTSDQIIGAVPGRRGAKRPGDNRIAGFISDMARYGGTDVSQMERMLRGLVNEETVRSSPVDYGLVAVELPYMHPVRLSKGEIPQGKLIDYILASSAYFPVFKSKEIGGARYIDGGYYDNLPAQLALRMGATEIIAVDLGSAGVVRSLKAPYPATFIASRWRLGQVLEFSPESAARNMRLGYLDALRAYRRLEGALYAFENGETRKNTIYLSGALHHIRQKTGISFLQNYRTAPGVRYRPLRNERRFAGSGMPQQITFGRALTCAAEAAGEILGLEPDACYSFKQFNAMLLERSRFLYGSRSGTKIAGRAAARQRRGRLGLWKIYRRLLYAWHTGKAPESLWPNAAMYPRAYLAANYLLALEVRSGRLE